MRYLKDFKSLLIFLIIFFFLISLFSSILFSEDVTLVNIHHLLEKDYLNQKELFNYYLLDFPYVDFNLNVNDFNYDEQYTDLLLSYSNLPKLERLGPFISKRDLKINFDNYNIIDSNLVSKKYTILKIFENNSFNEYVFIEILVFDNNLLIIDLINKDNILKSDKEIKQKTIYENEYIVYDENINYLISLYSADNYNSKPLLLFEKEEVILEELNLKNPNYIFNFFLVIIILIVIYYLFYFKNNIDLLKSINKKINSLKLKINKIIKKIDKKRKEI